jgi:AcrR family transcriptional regulator
VTAVAAAVSASVGDPSSPGDDPLRERLLAAATEVFAEKGYAGAGVAEIARRAGVTTGAIYSRYSGKAELLSEAIDAATAPELDSLFSDHRFEGRMEDILRIAGSHLVQRNANPSVAERFAPGMLLESFAAARHEPDVLGLLTARMADRRDRLADIVDAAKAGGGIDAELDTDALVTFCHAVGLGFLLLEVLDQELPGPEAWEELIGRLVSAVGDPSAFASSSATEPQTPASASASASAERSPG